MLEREIREMAFVPRWSIVRTNRQQYLAEHSYFVAMYANDIGVYLGLSLDELGKLLQMALWHDVEEIFSGDIPGPCKRAGMSDRKGWDTKLRGWLKQVFWRLSERDGSEPNRKWRLAPEAFEAIIKLADMIDECCEMGTELQMGNQTVEKVFLDSTQRVMAALEALAPLVPMLGSGPAYTKLRAMVGSALLASRHGDSKSTRIFEML